MTGMSEDALEQLVLADLGSLGWQVAYGPDIAPGEPATERAEFRDVVLVGRLRAALRRLNPHLPADAIDDAVKTALRPESQVVMTENWRAYQLLTQGVPVQYRDDNGEMTKYKVKYEPAYCNVGIYWVPEADENGEPWKPYITYNTGK